MSQNHLSQQLQYQFFTSIMIKAKLLHPKSRPHQKAKTLESFCKYQSNRFNQATFQNNFEHDKQKLVIPLSQTDLKIEQIKKKYGIPSKVHQHQRYFSVSDNFGAFHMNSSHPKGAPKVRSLSTVESHAPQEKKQNKIQERALINSKRQQNDNSIKQSRKQLKSSRVFNKQNYVMKESFSRGINAINPTQKIDYNNTFSQEILKGTKNQTKPLKQINYPQIVRKNLQGSQILQSRRSKRTHRTQQDFWSSSYAPRLQNIEKINSKIKSALQSFQNFEKKDISLSITKNKIEKAPEPKVKRQRTFIQNDLIETRVLQNIPIHRKTISNFNITKDPDPYTSLGASKTRYNPFARVKTQTAYSAKKQTMSQARPIIHQQDHLFSKIKNLYKRAEQIKDKKAQIMDSSPRPKRLHKPSQIKLQSTIPQCLRSSSLTPEKIQKLQDIKNKYINKLSYRSTFTQNDGEKTDPRLTTVRKNRSPQKSTFNLIFVKEDKSESFGDEIQNFQENQDRVNQLFASQLQRIITLTESGIQARKKTQQALKQKKIPETYDIEQSFSNFCQMLKRQIQLDEHLRQVKFWFKYQVKDKKWDQVNEQYCKLIKILKQNNQSRESFHNASWKLNFLIKSSAQRHFLNFQMLDEEIDPFFSLRVCQYAYKDLLDAYLDSEMNWQNICKSGIFTKLIKENWIQKIDSDSKGYVSLTDLTRFMNFNSQSFFKNRDLALIFKRITEDEQTQILMKNSRYFSNQPLNFQKISETLNLGVSYKRITAESLRRIETQFLCLI